MDCQPRDPCINVALEATLAPVGVPAMCSKVSDPRAEIPSTYTFLAIGGLHAEGSCDAIPTRKLDAEEAQHDR